MKSLQRRIQRSPLKTRLIIGGIDVSWNTLNNEGGHWQGHIYALVSGTVSPQLERQIQRVFMPSPETYRPSSVEPVDPTDRDFFKCLTYSYKSLFNWRSSYHESRLKRDGSPRINRRTNPLPQAQLAELTDWLSRYSVGDRLILTGVRRLRASRGKIRLGLVTP